MPITAITTRPVNARLANYKTALERLAQRYPDDYEAQVFYALALQAAASQNDTTYADQLKSVAILRSSTTATRRIRA